MRVGLFTESYDPVINGVSTSVKTLAAELTRSGHEPTVVAPGYPGIPLGVPPLPPFQDEPEAGISRVLRLIAVRTPLNRENPFVLAPAGQVARPLRSLTLDVVHTQQPFGMGMHGRIFARAHGLPLVSTFHTLYTEYLHYYPLAPRPVKLAFVNNVLRRYYQSCDAIIVPSREAGRRLQNLGVEPQRLHVIPTGVPPPPALIPAAVEQTRRAFSLPPRAPVLLYVGRLAREKNLELLLEAFAHILKESAGGTPETRPILLLAGSGPYREACEQLAERLGLSEQVRFAGFLRRNQLAPVYALATIFCFPSASETQGVVLTEAQGFGLPCVVVDGGGAPEFVRANVDALVVPGEVAPFVQAVQALLNDPEKRRAFAAAALASPLRPTPEKMAQEVIAVYETVCKNRRDTTVGRDDARRLG